MVEEVKTHFFWESFLFGSSWNFAYWFPCTEQDQNIANFHGMEFDSIAILTPALVELCTVWNAWKEY